MSQQSYLSSYASSPLVARDAELDTLNRLLEQAIGGQGSVALVSGEAGIGKTALVNELVREATTQGALVLSGGCYDLTSNSPYGPWRVLIDGYMVRAGRDRDLPVPPEALLPGEGSRSGHGRSDLLQQVTRFFSDLAESNPLLIILEDMHWADEDSLGLLLAISRQVATMPMQVVVTYRTPTEALISSIGQIVPALVREARAERLRLQPFDRQALEALVTRRYELESVDLQRLLKYLEFHSEGIPLFALELLRNAEEEGHLRPSDEGWVLEDLEQASVPPLLRDIVEARLSRLSGEVRQQLLVASIIGQDVALDVWRKAIAASEEDMIAAVESLAAADLVIPSSDGVTMRFSHALIHRAVYETILPPRRRALHRTIAEILENEPGADPDQVAWHFRQATDGRAGAWLVRAAERAQRAYAWTAAAERLIEADKLLEDAYDGGRRGWLRYRIGRLRRHADPVDARRWLELAERLGAAANDPVLVAYARFDRGHIEVLGGNFPGGLQRMTEADRLLERLDPELVTLDVAAWISDAIPQDSSLIAGYEIPGLQNPSDTRRGTLVQWLVEAGRFAEAEKLGRPLVDRLSRETLLDDQRTSSLGDAWFGLGRTMAQRGNPDGALEALDRALDCYLRIDHHLLISTTLLVQLDEVLIPYRTMSVERRRDTAERTERAYRRAVGIVDESSSSGFTSVEQMILEGRWAEARDILQVMASQPGGIIVWRQRAAAQLARLEYERGDTRAAWKYIESVLPAGPDTDPGTTTYAKTIELQLLAIELALDADSSDLASVWLAALERWLDWSGAAYGRALALLARARCALAGGDTEGARELATMALSAAQNSAQPLVIIAIERFLVQLEVADGQLDAASAYLDHALALSVECQSPFDVAVTKVALAERQLASGDREGASSLLDEASSELERLGASRMVSKADVLARAVEDSSETEQPPFGLSKREIDVLRLVAAGMTDAQVADELHISYRTVTTHLTSIFNKLSVNSRVSATRIAVEHGLV